MSVGKILKGDDCIVKLRRNVKPFRYGIGFGCGYAAWIGGQSWGRIRAANATQSRNRQWQSLRLDMLASGLE